MSDRLKLLSGFGSVVLIGAFLIVATGTAKATGDYERTSQSSNITWFADPDHDAGKPTGGASMLVRDRREIWLTGYVKGLDPMKVYTVWWIIFNNPKACVDGCDGDDLSNPAVEASELWATGMIADYGDGTRESAQGHFTAHLRNREHLGEVLAGRGLLDARGAEVHFIIRCHGRASAEDGSVTDIQISTLTGYCDALPKGCINVQAGAHLPPM